MEDFLLSYLRQPIAYSRMNGDRREYFSFKARSLAQSCPPNHPSPSPCPCFPAVIRQLLFALCCGSGHARAVVMQHKPWPHLVYPRSPETSSFHLDTGICGESLFSSPRPGCAPHISPLTPWRRAVLSCELLSLASF